MWADSQVEKLLAERNGKEQELLELLKLSPQDIWNRDLENFLGEWQISLEEDAQALKSGKPKAKSAIKAAIKKKKRAAGEDSDESDDFQPTKAPVKKAAPKAKAGSANASPAKRAT